MARDLVQPSTYSDPGAVIGWYPRHPLIAMRLPQAAKVAASCRVCLCMAVISG